LSRARSERRPPGVVTGQDQSFPIALGIFDQFRDLFGHEVHDYHGDDSSRESGEVVRLLDMVLKEKGLQPKRERQQVGVVDEELSQKELVPGADEGQEGHGCQPGSGNGNYHPHERRQLGAAVDSGGVNEFARNRGEEGCFLAHSEWNLGETASGRATIAEAISLAKKLDDINALAQRPDRCCCEDSLAVVRQRLEGICSAAGVSFQSLAVEVITAPTLRLDAPRDRERLSNTVQARQPCLLILDPLIRLHRLDENDASQLV
jgi:hypothetical protein